ncbi:MAG: blue (type 1) copper domain protein [Nocardioides sp.]|jgi:plastocyanin|nr:blue (type 1) copper domain protein [Nocardioides sp.]
MIPRILATLALVAGVAVLPSSPAAATDATVTVANMTFSPGTVTVTLGGTVTWHFADSMAHTTTSGQGFWNSGPKSSGQSFARAFSSAGSYGYICSIHPSMHGTVKVPLAATGSSAGGWTLRWSTGTAGTGRSFDVQVRLSGTSAWRSLRNDTTKATAKFDPSRSGSYEVRARTNNTSSSKSSGWSPARAVAIT